MKLSESGRKSSDGHFTLGRLFNELNSSNAARTARKLSLQETIHSASRHEAVCGKELMSPPEIRQLQMKTMRRSLQTELKNKAVTKKVSRRHSKSSGPKRDPKETADGMTAAVGGAKTSRVSSAISSACSENSVFKFGSEPVAKETLKSPTMGQMPPADHPPSVYSRHMRAALPEQMSEVPVTPEHVPQEKGITDTQDLSLFRPETRNSKFAANEIVGEGGDQGSGLGFISHEIVSSYNSSTEKETLSLTNTEDFDEDCSAKEREILVRMKDPELKASLRNIIMRRRSSVLRLIPTRTSHRRGSQAQGNDMENKKASLSSYDGNFDCESVFTMTDIESQRPSSSVSTIARLTASEQPKNSRVRSSTIPAGCVHAYDAGSLTQTSTASKSGTANAYSSSRRLYSARSVSSCGLFRSVSRSSVCSRNRSDVITEETRVIRPSTARSTSSSLLQRKSTASQPEITVVCQDRLTPEGKATMREKQMIREFLFMYAKVKQAPKAYHEAERVRMMSETPEFVIKSAIGQFLTRAFPSSVPTDSNTGFRTKEDRREDLQRMRLLRIKTCMEHLAAVAQ